MTPDQGEGLPMEEMRRAADDVYGRDTDGWIRDDTLEAMIVAALGHLFTAEELEALLLDIDRKLPAEKLRVMGEAVAKLRALSELQKENPGA